MKWRLWLAQLSAMEMPVRTGLTAKWVRIERARMNASSLLPRSSLPMLAQKCTSPPIKAAATAVLAPPPPTDSAM
jgi:hypothetical protein